MRRGHLIYIVGPHGGGQRRLVSYARRHCLGRAHAIFPRRYVSGGTPVNEECHLLSSETFDDWVDRGFFALHWGEDGVRYGIGREIDNWMDAGLLVVLVGSLQLAPRARARYRDMQMLLASPGGDALAHWAQADGACDKTRIAQIASDCEALERSLSGVPLIRTNQPLEAAARQLSGLIEDYVYHHVA